MSLFTGLSAFPPTPADADGVVDVGALAVLVDRLAAAGVESIGLLGSTGGYAYLDRAQRNRAVVAAVEAAGGRVPLIVGVGALRTSWSCDLARAAKVAGADGLLLAPMSYTPLTAGEVSQHVRAVAAAGALPLCIYNNPGTTQFRFGEELIAELAAAQNVAAIKMPAPQDGDMAGELARLRARTPRDFRIGYSGDWVGGPGLLAGADAWFSVAAGLLPVPVRTLARAARAGDVAATQVMEAKFAPLWALFREYGSLRLMYDIADHLGLKLGDPPQPLRRVDRAVRPQLEAAVEALG